MPVRPWSPWPTTSPTASTEPFSRSGTAIAPTIEPVTWGPEREVELLALAPGDAMSVLDVTGAAFYVTPSIEEVLGYGVDEYLAFEAVEIVHPADLHNLLDGWRTLIEQPGGRLITELRVRHRDGSYRWFETVLVNLLDDADVAGLVSILRDITDRRGIDTSADDGSRYEHLVQVNADVIGSLSFDGTLTWVSGAALEMLGYLPADMTGRPAWDFIHPDDVDSAIDRFSGALESIHPIDPIALRIRHADGRWVAVEIAAAMMQDDQGNNSELIISVRDVQWRQDALNALRDSERLFRTLAESSPIGVYQSLTAEGCIFVNERWAEITGLSFDEAKGWGWLSMLHPDDADLFGSPDDPLPFSGRKISIDFRLVRPDGEVRWAHIQNGPLRDSDGSHIGSVGMLEDVTDRHRSERQMQRLTDIFEATEDFVGICDTAGEMLYMNAAAKRLFGLGPDDDPGGRQFDGLFPTSVAERINVEIRPTIERDGRWSGELALARPGGGVVPVTAQLLMHPGNPGEEPYFSAILHDISERKAFEHRLAHQAAHDPLTGLPNRVLLLERLEAALARARRHNHRVAVLFLDLDHFKVVNDSLGHGLGDRLLIAIAERLALALRPGDIVARFGGDEFVVLCEDLVSPQDAIAIAERVDEALAAPFVIDDTEVFVGVSIGIALPDDADAEPETLIRDADAAMYRAKDRGRARWEMFDNAMRASAVDRLDIENALRRALERRELRVFYQPMIDLRTGRIDGVEALLRWEHPERGLLLPGDFITVAEETGLIVPIGAWVLDQACRQVQRWHASSERTGSLRVSVNISGRQLGHPRLVDDVATALADTGIDPADVELEITESVLMDDVEMSAETLGRLHALGVKLAVDDFGTGYSSLSYLRRFPVDLLKVDRSFVDGLGTDPGDSAIVTAIITLAHTLGLSAVAEGVESALQLAELRRLDCDRGQGYFMARPAGGYEIGELLAESPTW
jgi:diguanylate cyclase (GGDEF)-like protein/PAS domain S-box-containing protein